MARLTAIRRPNDTAEHYHLFVNEDTGRTWKAKLEIREVRAPHIENAETELAVAELNAVISVSPVDKKGKALLEAGKPVVIDSISHTFTGEHMKEPGFNPETRIMEMIADRIDLGEGRFTGVSRIREFHDNWKSKLKL